MININFTVVIPLYNKEKHINRAIKSVLNQTYKKFELLIIDDGSTDNSYEEAKKINDTRINIIRQKNEGVSAARNKGIGMAKNNFIAFLDADDEWKPYFLYKIKCLIDKFPSAGAYATSYEQKKENGNLIRRPFEKKFPKNWSGIIDDYFKYAINYPIITASSVVIPKYVFKKVGYFPVGIKRGEDLDLWIRIALRYDIVYYNQSCSIYYLDTKNRASEKESKLHEYAVNFAEKTLHTTKGKIKYTLYFEEYMIKRILIKARYLIKEDKKKEARALLYKYRYTKLNKKLLIKTYIISFLPKSFLDKVIFWKSKLRNFKKHL